MDSTGRELPLRGVSLGALLERQAPDAATVRRGITAFIEAAKMDNCNYDRHMQQELLGPTR